MRVEWFEEATKAGWHYNVSFNTYQKVRGRVFVYVSRLLFGGYMAQLYSRGYREMGSCLLEIRTNSYEKLPQMFTFGEEWLEKYKSGDQQLIEQDTFSVSNPNGAWDITAVEKKYWI
jgi:hypothetical protein